ncbi:MAG: hypothetical protein GWP03_04960 [Proteobacteria bacterium]|nr:hypothetical protein [Pseudomonadota bacterium]
MSDYKKAELYISQNKVNEAVKVLTNLYKTSRDTAVLPGVILHLADLTSDAELSAKYYKELYKKFPKRKEATLALIRLGQYYYAMEAYKMAISYFSKAFNRPLSNFARQKVQYWLGKSFAMIDMADSARIYFSLVVNKDTLSPYYKLSKTSLEKLSQGKTENRNIPIETAKDTSEKYGIQIGVFSNKSNANKLEEKYKSKGYNVFIFTTSPGGNTRYKVIIGKFNDKSDAEDYIKIFRKAEGISGWITKISD